MNKELFKILGKEYGLGELLDVQKVEKGYLTKNYKLTAASDEFFLKQYGSKSSEELAFTHMVQNFFSSRSIPAVLPLLTLAGQSYISIQSQIYELYPYVYGISYERKDLTSPLMDSMGSVLGTMHEIGKKSNLSGLPSVKESRERANFDAFVTRAQELLVKIRRSGSYTDFDMAAEKSLNFKLQAVQALHNPNASVPELEADTLVHGDYQDQNIFFDEQGKIKYIFDFEKCKLSSRHSEIARALVLMCFGLHADDRSYMLATSFINGYKKTNRIDPVAFNHALQTHINKIFCSTWVESEHYEKNNNATDSMLVENYRLLEYFFSNKEVFVDRILAVV